MTLTGIVPESCVSSVRRFLLGSLQRKKRLPALFVKVTLTGKFWNSVVVQNEIITESLGLSEE